MLPLRRSSQLRFAAGRFVRPNLERGYEPRCKGAFQGADPCLPLHFQAVGRRAVPTLADVLRVCAASHRAEWRLARLLARLIALYPLRPRRNARSRSGAGYPVRPSHVPSLALRPLAMTGQLGSESRSTKCLKFGGCVRLELSDFHQRCIARIEKIAVEVDDRRDELHKVVESDFGNEFEA